MFGDSGFDRHFIAYGVRICIRTDRATLFDMFDQDPLREPLPFGWRPVEGADVKEAKDGDGVSVRYELRSDVHGGASAPYCVYSGTDLIADCCHFADAAHALFAHAERFVAERAPNHLFVHAGVVGWEGCAIVMPGASFAGKTTLVKAWLEAGATYYSDEFAVLDRAGRVHPFARPLAIRDASTALTRRVPAAALGAETGTTPLPIGFVLVTSYRAGSCWRPRRLTPAPAVLALMRHTVAARGNPKHSMPILKQAVLAGTSLAGLRGEADALVEAISRHGAI